MPLEPDLLELENELRSLKPLELDFPTGQRLVAAVTTPDRFHVAIDSPALGAETLGVTGGLVLASSRWRRAVPWSAAAAIAVGGVAILDRPPEREADSAGNRLVSSMGPPKAAARGSMKMIFPDGPRSVVFGPAGGDADSRVAWRGEEGDSPAPKGPIVIPEALSPYGYLNLNCFDLPEDYCQRIGISGGVAISAMGSDGPAATHGLEIGDIILKFNDEPVRAAEGLSRAVRASAPGNVVTLTIRRGWMTGQIRVRLASAPSA